MCFAFINTVMQNTILTLVVKMSEIRDFRACSKTTINNCGKQYDIIRVKVVFDK